MWATPFSLGLSPRGRGNPDDGKTVFVDEGTIPARAGEPRSLRGSPRCGRDYPRAGGGTLHGQVHDRLRWGLSPRGRGNRLGRLYRAVPRGTIPARAGEPSSTYRRRTAPWDYPRAGGGTTSRKAARVVQWGLSPRGRGNPGRLDRLDDLRGTIPARAGEPSRRRRRESRGRDYPRAGGGTASKPSATVFARGLSPRGRGNPFSSLEIEARSGTIPARAGEPPPWKARPIRSGDYPRAGGGTKIKHRITGKVLGLSPRGRGNRLAGGHRRFSKGTIPARAGEPSARGRMESGSRDYPRAGGGTTVSSCSAK